MPQRKLDVHSRLGLGVNRRNTRQDHLHICGVQRRLEKAIYIGPLKQPCVFGAQPLENTLRLKPLCTLPGKHSTRVSMARKRIKALRQTPGATSSWPTILERAGAILRCRSSESDRPGGSGVVHREIEAYDPDDLHVAEEQDPSIARRGLRQGGCGTRCFPCFLCCFLRRFVLLQGSNAFRKMHCGSSKRVFQCLLHAYELNS